MRRKLDSYFKEKLNQPQQAPEDAWENIQSRLPKEKKRPFIPFWTKISGIAAVGIFLIGGFFVLNNSSNQSIIHTTETDSSIVDAQTNPNSTLNSNTEIQTNNHIKIEETNHLNHQNISAETASIYSKPNESNESNFSSNHGLIQNSIENSQETHWANSIENLENSIFSKNKIIPIFDFNSMNDRLSNENLIASLNVSKNEISDQKLENLTINDQKKSNPKKKINADFNKFTLSGFISPMALNTFVGKSMLSDEMSNYKTDNNITLAYGIKGAYALNEKIKIRTGISKIGFEQFTRNVPLIGNVATTPSANTALAVSNINYNSQLRVVNLNPQSLANAELNLSTYGDMQQQSEYIEIPIEAEFALFQNESIGISATGGGSTWLLAKNKIYVHADNYTEELGRANNLNKTSFSANAGLKFDMKISEEIQINVEPHFKYLINTVSDIDKYNPYTVGVNAGISISLK